MDRSVKLNGRDITQVGYLLLQCFQLVISFKIIIMCSYYICISAIS